MSWVEMDRRRVKPVCTHECWPLTYGGPRRKIGFVWVIGGRFRGIVINVTGPQAAPSGACRSTACLVAAYAETAKKAPVPSAGASTMGICIIKGAGTDLSRALRRRKRSASRRVGVGAVSCAGSLQPLIVANGLAEIDLGERIVVDLSCRDLGAIAPCLSLIHI